MPRIMPFVLGLVLALAGLAQAGKPQSASADLSSAELVAAVKSVGVRSGEDPVETLLRGMSGLGDFRVSGPTVQQALRDLGVEQTGELGAILLGNLRDITVTRGRVVIRNAKEGAHKLVKDGKTLGVVYPGTQISFDLVDRGQGQLKLDNIKGLKVSKDVDTSIAGMNWLELNRSADRRWIRFQASGGPFNMFSEVKEFDLPKPEPPAVREPLPKPLPLPPLEPAPLPKPDDVVLGPPPLPQSRPTPTQPQPQPDPTKPDPTQPAPTPADPDVAPPPRFAGDPGPEPGRALSPEELEAIIRDIERREAWREARDAERHRGTTPKPAEPQGQGIIKKVKENVPSGK